MSTAETVFHIGPMQVRIGTLDPELALPLGLAPFCWSLTGPDCNYLGQASTWRQANTQAVTTALLLLPPRRRATYEVLLTVGIQPMVRHRRC